MIVGERKSLQEIMAMIGTHQKVLILGCRTCVAVCMAGGEKEVAILASQLRIASKLNGDDKVFREGTVERQCEYEFLDEAVEDVEWADVVVSLACGIGVQTTNEYLPQKQTLPGLNTTFLGQPTELGVWEERCQACGNCVLDLTGGICPVTRCSKGLLNGPCGGSHDGKCEVSHVVTKGGQPVYVVKDGKKQLVTEEVDCAWQLIYDRLKALGKLDQMQGIQAIPIKDWRTSRDGGPRRIVRADMIIDEES